MTVLCTFWGKFFPKIEFCSILGEQNLLWIHKNTRKINGFRVFFEKTVKFHQKTFPKMSINKRIGEICSPIPQSGPDLGNNSRKMSINHLLICPFMLIFGQIFRNSPKMEKFWVFGRKIPLKQVFLVCFSGFQPKKRRKFRFFAVFWRFLCLFGLILSKQTEKFSQNSKIFEFWEKTA